MSRVMDTGSAWLTLSMQEPIKIKRRSRGPASGALLASESFTSYRYGGVF